MSPPIIVADFDFTRRYVIAHALRNAGLDVVEVGDVDEAEKVRTERGCSLAFIAARVSGGDGFAVCKQWSARGVRVVLVSTDFRANEIFRMRANEAGAVALLSSMGNRDEIVSVARRLLGPRSASG